MLRKGAEEARNQLPDLLEAAEKGRSTIITRHGRPVAALVPIAAYGAAVRQQPLTLSKDPAPGYGGTVVPIPFATCVTNGVVRVRTSARARIAPDRLGADLLLTRGRPAPPE